MSEHIQIQKFRKDKQVFGTSLLNDGVSEEAHKSTLTKVSKVAEVSPLIAL